MAKPSALNWLCFGSGVNGIEPYQEMVGLRVAEWHQKFSKVQGGKAIVSLTGETSADLRLLEEGDVIVCTPMQVCFRLPSNHHLSFICVASIVGCPLEALAAAKECPKYRLAHC